MNAKDDYFYNLGQKLSRKSYWMVLKKILNKKKYTFCLPKLCINPALVKRAFGPKVSERSIETLYVQFDASNLI